jgi:hypothetical protein
MLQLIQQSLLHQFGASLQMLETCIEKCNEKNWTGTVGRHPFWHVAYHLLFYVDLYLSPSEGEFRRRPFHREGYNSFDKVVADQPYDKATILQYVQICRAKVIAIINAETEESLNGPSGFDWLPFPRLGTHLYNLRHIHHHAGQLGAFLARTQDVTVPWVRFSPLETT